jgi:predicted RNA-binding Zn ribbon-like protein
VKINEAAPHRTFQLVAAHPALDFVNTLDWRFRGTGPEELLQTYGDLVRFTGQSNLLSPRHAQHLLRTTASRKAAKTLASSKELREAMAAALYSSLSGRPLAATQLKTLERHFQTARHHQKLHWNGSHLKWSWTEAQDEPELPLWLLSQSASSLMTSEVLSMVRACDNPKCQWLFLDTSKNHTRRWCDMKLCGNRMKARRFKAHRAS